MKTTPDGLTHLINMLVDVVNLQRKALATPGASCNVELGYEDSRLIVHVIAGADVQAEPPPVTLEQFGGKGDRMLTPADIDAAEMALVHSPGATPRQAAQLALAAVGLGLPLSADNNSLTMDEMVAAQRDAIARARMAETDEPAA